MSNFIAASSASIAPRATLARLAVVASSVFGLLLSLPRGAAAQTIDPSSPRWELRFSSGALVGTGNQRTAIKDANFSAAQLSWLVRPSVAVTGTFGWARSRDLQSAKLDVFTSDLGVELRPARLALNGALSFAPFVGAGAGARSYNYRSQNVDATNNLAGYGAVGGEFGFKRVGLRLEVRDYATGFKPLVGAGTSDARNDLVFMAAIRLKKPHTASQQAAKQRDANQQ